MKAINERLQEGLDHFMESRLPFSHVYHIPLVGFSCVSKKHNIFFLIYTLPPPFWCIFIYRSPCLAHKPFEGADGYKKAQQVRDDFINNLNGKTND
jgi:hypothetical protein